MKPHKRPHFQPCLPHLRVPKSKAAPAAVKSKTESEVRAALQRGFHFPTGHPVVTYQLKPRRPFASKQST